MRGVAIVGAGPAGLVIAHLLQRERIPLVVFERKTRADLCRLPKAGLIEYRTVQLLRRENIAPSILDFSVENHRFEFRTPDESVVLDYAALTGGRPHYIYPQHQLVHRLCETLTEAGGDIRFGHTVCTVRQDPGGVVLSVEGPDGDRPQVRCEVAVGCEGSKSPVAAAMTGPGSASNPFRPGCWPSLGRRRHWKPTPFMPRIRAGSPGRCAAARTRRGTCWRSPPPTPPPTGPNSGPATSSQPASVSANGWKMSR
jgi:p-hydroxybenzoate 3-monooxygenase